MFKNKLSSFSSVKHMNKEGFTLAETMIAMVIIGALAAILIPSVFKAAPDKNKVMFKKAYNTLEKAVGEMINDDVNYPELVDNYYTTINRGFNCTVNPSNSSYYAHNKFSYLLTEELNVVGTPTYLASGSSGYAYFTTSDGIYWTVYIPRSDSTTQTTAGTAAANTTAVQFPLADLYTTLVTFDVNGTANGPNCSSVVFSNPTTTACAANVTPDKYQIGIRYDGKLQVNTSDTVAIGILSDPTKLDK